MVNIVYSVFYPTRNISLLEILRAAFGLIGIGASMSLALRSFGDLVFLWKGNINGPREYSAATSIRLHVSILIVQILVLGISIIALTQPKPPRGIPSTIVSSSLFIAAIVLLTVMSLETDRRKRALIERLENERDITT